MKTYTIFFGLILALLCLPALAQTNTTVGTATINTANITTLNVTKFQSKGPDIDVRFFGAVPDGTTDSTTAINNAITYANTVGGTVRFPVGSGDYIYSGSTTIGTSSIPVHLLIDAGENIRVKTNNSAADVFKLENYSCIMGTGGATWGKGGIVLDGSANIKRLITNARQGLGQQEAACIDNLMVTADYGATLVGPAVDFNFLFVPTYIANTTITNFNAVNLSIENSGNINLYNVFAQGCGATYGRQGLGACANSEALDITDSGSFTVGSIYSFGGTWQGASPGHPVVRIQGASSEAAGPVQMYGNYIEQAQTKFPISSITRTSNVVTATVAPSDGGTPYHNYAVGLGITFSGVTDSSFNGSCTITSMTQTTVTCSQTGANATSSGGNVDVTTPGPSLLIKDANRIRIDGWSCWGAYSGDCIQLAQDASYLTHDVTITNIDANGSTAQKVINNTINGETLTGDGGILGDTNNYTYQAHESGRRLFEDLKAPTSVTGTSGGALTIVNPFASDNSHYACINFGIRDTTTPGSPQSRICNENSGSGSKLHFATSNNYASGVTTDGMQLDPNGNLSVSGAYNVGNTTLFDRNIGTVNASNFAFETNGAERWVLDSGGNIWPLAGYSLGVTGHPLTIIITNLPTSCSGQASGTLYNSSGTVMVCP